MDYTIYVDRFYRHIQLAEEMAEVNTGLVGTVMKNRKGLSKTLKEVRLNIPLKE